MLISNLECYNYPTKYASILSGIPGYAIEDVKIANVYVESTGAGTEAMAQIQPAEKADGYPEPGMFGAMPAYGFYLRHLRNLEMSHVEIATAAHDARPAFCLEDVERADFFAITAQAGTSSGAFALRSAKDVRIGWSRAAQDATIPSAQGKILYRSGSASSRGPLRSDRDKERITPQAAVPVSQRGHCSISHTVARRSY